DFVKRDRHALPARAAEGDVDVAVGIHGGIRHRMQIVGDLKADRDGERLALTLRVRDLNRAAAGALWNTRDQTITAGEGEECFRLSKADDGARARPRGEDAAVHGNFAARNGRGWGDAFDPRNAVLFC